MRFQQRPVTSLPYLIPDQSCHSIYGDGVFRSGRQIDHFTGILIEIVQLVVIESIENELPRSVPGYALHGWVPGPVVFSVSRRELVVAAESVSDDGRKRGGISRFNGRCIRQVKKRGA